MRSSDRTARICEEAAMRTFWLSLVGVGLAVVGVTAVAAAGPREKKRGDTRFFEMRTYHAAPGKMEALHARFRDHTCKLFAKHGITIIGFWTPADPKEAERTLIYLLAYPSPHGN